MATCYMCPREAVSSEHVPPLCLFPEPKDLPLGVDLRKNLIKVPSCVVHNLQKSNDDEYLLLVLIAGINANATARQQVSTKLMRALQKRPSKYRMFGRVYEISLFGKPTGMFFVNRARFDRSIEYVARGLYYHHFHEPWLEPIQVYSPVFAVSSGPNPREAARALLAIEALAANFLSAQPSHGENPEVFTYKIALLGKKEGFVVRMLFYGGIPIIAVSHPSLSLRVGAA